MIERTRLEEKRIYGNGNYIYHNWGMYALERRKSTWSRNVCQLMIEHKNELRDDPERLSTEFIINTVKSIRKKVDK